LAKSQQFLTVFLTFWYCRIMVDEQTYSIDDIERQTGFDRRTIAYYVQQGLLPKVGRRGPRTRYSQLFFNRLRFIKKIRDLQDRGAMGTMTLADFREYFQTTPEETVADVVEGREPPPTIGREPSVEVSAIASPRARQTAMARRIENLRRSGVEEQLTASVVSSGLPMDPAQDAAPEIDADEAYAEGTYLSLPDVPESAEDRDTPSGEHHRLTLGALERNPGAPIPDRKIAPPPPADQELQEALARLSAVVRRQPRAYLRTTETWTRARVSEELALSARGLRGLDDRHLPLLEQVARILRRIMREGEGGV
jgi:DNA-binding transcriptional MerR regulator